ncbi:MAG: phosphopyruvate hydratase [Candidatus Roizmanbacteria bacterium]|nr:phosphopyruvate hydratase [Candidatus Roizmanbacteria bacterium]
MLITGVRCIEILDSRGFPTLKTFVELDTGVVGSASVPSGASTGVHEAHELRDEDPKRYQGKGVLKAQYAVENELAPLLIGKNPNNQQQIDAVMIAADGTENKSRLGANAILSASLAVAKAASVGQKKELYEYLASFFETTSYVLPVPLINVINGGKHASQSSDFQEYMIIPYGFTRFAEALRAAAEVFQVLKKKVTTLGHSTTVGDEGGFALPFKTNEEPLQLLMEAIEESSYVDGQEIALGIDAAASEFYANNEYRFATNQASYTTKQLSDYYAELVAKYPLVSLEDPFAEDDWDGFVDLTEKIGATTQIVGDDLYVTNKDRLRRGIEKKASNSILIKLNQIGTLSETIDAIQQAKMNDMTAVISHRSGETEDTFIADLVVASGVGQIKTGSMSRSERLAKYNRLLEIEHLEKDSTFASFPFKKD